MRSGVEFALGRAHPVGTVRWVLMLAAALAILTKAAAAQTAVAVHHFQNVDSVKELDIFERFIPDAISLSLKESGQFAIQNFEGYDELFQAWRPPDAQTHKTEQDLYEALQNRKIRLIIGGFFRPHQEDVEIRFRVLDAGAKRELIDESTYASKAKLTQDIITFVSQLKSRLLDAILAGTATRSVVLLGIVGSPQRGLTRILMLPLGKRKVPAPWLGEELYDKLASSISRLSNFRLINVGADENFSTYRYTTIEEARGFLRDKNLRPESILYGNILLGEDLAVELHLVEVATGTEIVSLQPHVLLKQWPDMFDLLPDRALEALAGSLTVSGEWFRQPQVENRSDPAEFYTEFALKLVNGEAPLSLGTTDRRRLAVIYLRKALDYPPKNYRDADLQKHENQRRASLHFELGKALSEESPDDAIQEFAEAIHLGYENPSEANYRLAKVEMAKEEYQSAASFYELALQEGAKPESILPDLAAAYWSMRNLQKAAQCYTQYLQLMPGAYNIRHSLARVYHQSGKFDDEIAQLTNLQQADPRNREVLRDLGSAHATKGRLHYQKKEIPSSIAEYEQAVAADPAEKVFYLSLGFLYLIHEDPEKAEAILLQGSKVLAEDKDGRLANRLGITHWATGKFDLALPEFNLAIQNAPDNISFLTNRAYLFFTKGEFEKGLADLKLLAEKHSDNVLILLDLAQVYRILGSFGEAEKYLSQAEHLPNLKKYDYFNIEFEWAMNEEQLGNEKAAEQHYAKAHAISEELVGGTATSAMYLDFAILDLFRRKDFEEAIRYCKKVLADPEVGSRYSGGPATTRVLGALSYEVGQYERARDLLESSLPDIRYPWQRALSHYYLGMTYLKLGNFSLARKNFESAVADAPRYKYGILARQEAERLRGEPKG